MRKLDKMNAHLYKASSVIILLAIAASLAYLSYLRHEKRILFTESQNLIRERDRLEIDWSRLLSEKIVYNSLPRVEEHAREHLGLINPDYESTMLVINEQVVRK